MGFVKYVYMLSAVHVHVQREHVAACEVILMNDKVTNNCNIRR